MSIQEVSLALSVGVAPEKIIYTPNGVSLEEIENVAKKGVQINIDNLSILELFSISLRIEEFHVDCLSARKWPCCANSSILTSIFSDFAIFIHSS